MPRHLICDSYLYYKFVILLLQDVLVQSRPILYSHALKIYLHFYNIYN